MIIRQDHDASGGGLAEHGTVAVLLPAILLGCWAAIRVFRDDALLAAWLAVWTLGALYFALEEASWGQWYFGWETPEYFKDNNKQQETNLHNTYSWLNRPPRRLLELWIVVMGVVYPTPVLVGVSDRGVSAHRVDLPGASDRPVVPCRALSERRAAGILYRAVCGDIYRIVVVALPKPSD
jgi:hypothetical protein